MPAKERNETVDPEINRNLTPPLAKKDLAIASKRLSPRVPVRISVMPVFLSLRSHLLSYRIADGSAQDAECTASTTIGAGQARGKTTKHARFRST